MKRTQLTPTEAAAVKLERIIAREGDLGGLRRNPEYLEMLVIEEMQTRDTIRVINAAYNK